MNGFVFLENCFGRRIENRMEEVENRKRRLVDNY